MVIHRELISERLFIGDDLAPARRVALAPPQAHYLTAVLRLKSGAKLLVFNGRDGEWVATLAEIYKCGATLTIDIQARPQDTGPDLDYLFAPLKRSRLDYMVQKATEMGVARLRPIITERTIAERVNSERMRANAIEAAEQCGILRVPGVAPPAKLDDVLGVWDPNRRIIYCNEEDQGADPITALKKLGPGSLAVLVGPEGGFSPCERERLIRKTFVVSLSLGPRIMRADTAAVAVLALVNATLGDWCRD